MTKRLFSTQSEYKKAAKAIKQLDPSFKVDLRKQFTPQQKAKITKAYKQYKPDSIHAKRYQEIKQYIEFEPDFKKGLNRYQQDKIKRYHETVKQLKSRRHIEYKSSNNNRLEKAQNFGQHPAGFKELNTAFIPVTSDEKPRVRFNAKGEMVLHLEHTKSVVIPFDQAQLAIDPKKHVLEKVAGYPEFDNFKIHAGDRMIPTAYTSETVAKKITKLVSQYGNEEKNNFYGNWLSGMTANQFKKQASKAELKKAMAKKRRKKKRKAKRKAKRKQ